MQTLSDFKGRVPHMSSWGYSTVLPPSVGLNVYVSCKYSVPFLQMSVGPTGEDKERARGNQGQQQVADQCLTYIAGRDIHDVYDVSI